VPRTITTKNSRWKKNKKPIFIQFSF